MAASVDKAEQYHDLFRDFSRWLEEHPVAASLILLTCALLMRALFAIRADPSQLVFPDSGTYLDPALSLREAGAFLNKYQSPEITRTPGYPVFLAALMVFCGTDLRMLLIIQATIVSSSVVVLYWLARSILPAIMAFAGALLAAFSPWASARAGFLLSDSLFLLVLIALFSVMYLVVRYARTTRLVLIGGSCVGVLTSAVVFVRPVFPLVPLVALTIFVLYPGKRTRAWCLVAAMLVCALSPLHLWKMRNLHEAQFNGFSDVAGKAAWQWLASSVKAQIPGASGDRWTMLRAAEQDETHWSLSLQQANDKRWGLAKEVFTAHPFLTTYAFAMNAIEALIHPEPDILDPARFRFYGDTVALAGLWAVLLLCAGIGLRGIWSRSTVDLGIDRNWLIALLIISSVITITGGVSFGAGARYRLPLEPIVSLMAGVGLVQVVTFLYNKRRMVTVHRSSLDVQV